MANTVATGKKSVAPPKKGKNDLVPTFRNPPQQKKYGKRSKGVPKQKQGNANRQKKPKNSHNKQSSKGYKNDVTNKKNKTNLPNKKNYKTNPKKASGFQKGKPKAGRKGKKVSPLKEARELDRPSPRSPPAPKSAPKLKPELPRARPRTPKTHRGVERSSLRRIPQEFAKEILGDFLANQFSDRRQQLPPGERRYQEIPFQGVSGQRYIYVVNVTGPPSFKQPWTWETSSPASWPNWGGDLIGPITDFSYRENGMIDAQNCNIGFEAFITHAGGTRHLTGLVFHGDCPIGAAQSQAKSVKLHLFLYPIGLPQEEFDPQDYRPTIKPVAPPIKFIPPHSPQQPKTPLVPNGIPRQPPQRPPYHPPYSVPPEPPEPELEPQTPPAPLLPPAQPYPDSPPDDTPTTPKQKNNPKPKLPTPNDKPGLTPGGNPSKQRKNRRGNDKQEQVQYRGQDFYQDSFLQQMPIIPSPNPPPISLPSRFRPRTPQQLLPPPNTCKCAGKGTEPTQEGGEELKHVNITIPDVTQYYNPLTFKWEAKKTTKQVQVLASSTGSDAAQVKASAERQVLIAEAVIRAKNLPRNLGLIVWWQRLNFLMALHNAMHLSASLVQTVGDLMSLGLDVVGIDGEDGSPLDINELVGEGINDFLESKLGEERWTNTKSWFASANKIYQASANIVYTVQSMFDSSKSALDWMGGNVSRIGNALKKSGTIVENSFGWMSEQPRISQKRQGQLDKIIDGVDSVDEAASSLTSVTGDIKSIQDEAKELKDLRKEFDKSLAEFPPGSPLENEPIKAEAEAEKAASGFPDGDIILDRAE